MVVADVDFPTPPLCLVSTKTRVMALPHRTVDKSLCWQGHREGVPHSSTGVLLAVSASPQDGWEDAHSPNHRIAKVMSMSETRSNLKHGGKALECRNSVRIV